MRPEQKTKSRQKLYNAINGVKSIVGAAGAKATASVVFSNNPTEGETFTVTSGGTTTTFTFYDSGNEPGTDTTIEVTIGAGLTNTIDNLITDMHANTTTNAWGFLYPADSVGLANSGGTTLVVNLWPGTWGNSVVFAGTAEMGAASYTAAGGVDAPSISPDYNVNTIDTTGSAANQEYYVLNDGEYIGQQAQVLIASAGGSDTPTIVGKLSEGGTAMVECEFITAEPGQQVTFAWTGSVWEMVNWNDLLTVPDFTASA